MASPDIGAAVADVLGSSGDPTVLEYITSCLEDFELGDDGEEAFESFGPMMVRMPLSHPLWHLELTKPVPSSALMVTCAQTLQSRTATSACLYGEGWPPCCRLMRAWWQTMQLRGRPARSSQPG